MLLLTDEERAIKLPQRFRSIPLTASIKVFHYSIETATFARTAILGAVEADM